MAALLTTITSVVTSLFTGVGNVISTIMASGNELLLIPTGIAFAYACVKIVRRFIISF